MDGWKSRLTHGHVKIQESGHFAIPREEIQEITEQSCEVMPPYSDSFRPRPCMPPFWRSDKCREALLARAITHDPSAIRHRAESVDQVMDHLMLPPPPMVLRKRTKKKSEENRLERNLRRPATLKSGHMYAFFFPQRQSEMGRKIESQQDSKERAGRRRRLWSASERGNFLMSVVGENEKIALREGNCKHNRKKQGFPDPVQRES